MAPITMLNNRWVRRLSASSALGHHQLVVGGAGVQPVEQLADDPRRLLAAGSRLQADDDLVERRGEGRCSNLRSAVDTGR